MGMWCPICGARNPQGTEFCGSCGGEMFHRHPAPGEVERSELIKRPPARSAEWIAHQRRIHRVIFGFMIVAVIIFVAMLGVLISQSESSDARITDFEVDEETMEFMVTVKNFGESQTSGIITCTVEYEDIGYSASKNFQLGPDSEKTYKIKVDIPDEETGEPIEFRCDIA